MSDAIAVRKPVYRSLLLAGCLMVLTLLLFPRVYLENDDLGFVYLLSHGFYAPWVSKPFCWLLLHLYAAFPGLGWYGLLHYLILAVELGVLFWLVGDWATEHRLSRKTGRWLGVAAFLLFYPFILRLTFTCSSIWSGGLGLLALLACFRRWKQPVTLAQWFWPVLGCGAVFSLCYLVRPEGLGAMVFLIPAVLAALCWAKRLLFSRQGVAMALTFLLPLLLWVMLDKAVLKYPPAEVPYQTYVVKSNDVFGFAFTEQYKNHLPWLSALGWSRNDYGMLERFLYWDETVFSQAKIDQLSAKTPTYLLNWLRDLLIPGIFVGRMMKTVAKTWLSNYPFTVYCLGLFILFSMMATGRLSRFFPGAALFALFMGSVLMQSLLRFPYRVACPTILVCTLSLLTLPGFDLARLKDGRGRLKTAPKVVLVVSALFLLVFNGPVRWYKTWAAPVSKNRARLAELNQLQAQYYIMREAGVIQISVSDPLDPAPLKYPDIGPGWLIQSPPYYMRLRAFGIPNGAALIPASFNNPRVLYFFKDKNLTVLQTYLLQHYGRTGNFVPVENLLSASFFKNSHLYRLVMKAP